MNAVNSLSRELAQAKADIALEQANRWPDQIKPLIQTYLELGAMLDRLEQHFNGWKPSGAHEDLMSQVHSALAKDHGALRRDIEDWRYDRIEDALPRPYSRNMTDDEHEAHDALSDHLMASALSVDAAISAQVPA